jgi:hypothetical protein
MRKKNTKVAGYYALSLLLLLAAGCDQTPQPPPGPTVNFIDKQTGLALFGPTYEIQVKTNSGQTSPPPYSGGALTPFQQYTIFFTLPTSTQTITSINASGVVFLTPSATNLTATFTDTDPSPTFNVTVNTPPQSSNPPPSESSDTADGAPRAGIKILVP